MEYKNAYESLIEAVRKLLKANPSDEGIQNWAKDNVPQIFESEDERIRKWIVDELKSSLHDIEALYSGDYDNRDKNDIIREDYLRKAIAFLEKRGEQKLIMIQWQGNNLKEVIDFTGKDKNFEKWFKSFEEYEQYVQMHNGIFKLFNADGSHYEIPVGAWIVKTPDGYNVPSKAKYIQKPTAWSEEDLICLGYLADFVDKNGGEFYGNNKPYVVKFIRSLANLTTPQQEWSEEDEEMYKEVLTDIIYAKNDLEAKECLELSKRAMKAFNWFSKRYKSLRPQNTWKPTDEQMKLRFGIRTKQKQSDR